MEQTVREGRGATCGDMNAEAARRPAADGSPAGDAIGREHQNIENLYETTENVKSARIAHQCSRAKTEKLYLQLLKKKLLGDSLPCHEHIFEKKFKTCANCTIN